MVVTTVNEGEIQKFSAMAHDWWNPKGKFAPLHRMNEVRVASVRDCLSSHYGPHLHPSRCLYGLEILDVGCGGGLLAEPLARLGARVTGIDASAATIEIAQHHAKASGLAIEYECATVESMVTKGRKFHAVIASEIIEHVSQPLFFVEQCAQLLLPEGIFCASTINRTPKSYLAAIVGAEYVLRWLPPGTHDWKAFVTPEEFRSMLHAARMEPLLLHGWSFQWWRNRWQQTQDTGINYFIAAVLGNAAPQENQ
jgi:2-polyprenyl-6-hydroxyphenyl methylase/3-demethylubiquinone-9 3-methyltransferase